jgi:NADH-quinone oxidoreductase subunit L
MALFDVQEHPGLLFVWATLLPLISFTFLLIAAAVRAYIRPVQEAGGQVVTPPAWPAYVATGAIGASFLLCLAGSILFFRDHAEAKHIEENIEQHAEGEQQHQQETVKKEEQREAEIAKRWEGHLDWLTITPDSTLRLGSILRVGFRIDHLSVVMFLMVTFIATLIHLFSMGYMSDELQPMVEDHQVHAADGHYKRRGRFGRFFLYLSLFCFSMLNLILADNFFQIFISWELVGLCSYLLIGFYFERRSASTAANKAFITNRVGDAGFIIGLLILWAYFGTLNFQDLYARVRAPAADSQNHQYKLAGKLVHVAPEGEPKDDVQAYKWTSDGSGSHVVLFPLKEDHLHGIGDQKDQKTSIEVPVTGAPTNEYGVIPHWLLVVAGLGIFLGCVGKSAQFPLHVWLPDAMEGPTPVSALIHAATMVAAGVYLVGRTFPLFTSEALLVIAYTGGITLFLAATIAIVMTDIKKVLAYSTVSQLGYMMLAIGVGGVGAGLFHLVTHAFFKALLFLGSGSVIYGCHHEQEMTKMGGLFPKMRITAVTMLIGVFTIAGIPLFSGWYSKDAILAHALGFSIIHPQHGLLFLLPLITAGITTFYMFRMWFMTFTGKPRDHHVYDHAHESPWLMTVPLILLAFFSVTVAWGWPVWNAEESHLGGLIEKVNPAALEADFGPSPHHEHGGHAVDPLGTEELNATRSPSVLAMVHQYHGLAGGIATGVVAMAIIFASVVYWKRFQVLDPAEAKEAFPRLHAFLANKWYFDELYSAILVRPALVVATWARGFDANVIDRCVNAIGSFAVLLSRWNGLFDARIIDGLVNLLAQACYGLGARLRGVQTGYLRSYVLFLALAVVGVFVLVSLLVARALAG